MVSRWFGRSRSWQLVHQRVVAASYRDLEQQLPIAVALQTGAALRRPARGLHVGRAPLGWWSETIVCLCAMPEGDATDVELRLLPRPGPRAWGLLGMAVAGLCAVASWGNSFAWLLAAAGALVIGALLADRVLARRARPRCHDVALAVWRAVDEVALTSSGSMPAQLFESGVRAARRRRSVAA